MNFKVQDGISLVEIIIVITIAAILGSAILRVFTNSSKTINKESVQISQGLSANEAISQISEAIRLSSQVTASYPSSSPQYLTSSNTLVLQVPALDSSGMVKEDVYDYFIFSPDQTNSNILRKKVFPDPTSSRKSENRVLLTNLNKVIFSFLDNNKNTVSPVSATTISFSIIQQTNYGIQTSVSSQSAQVSLRNL